MRRHFTRPFLLGLLAVAFASAVAFDAGLLPRGADSPAHAQADACSAAPFKSAAPARIRLGEQVTVALRVAGACPAREQKADVVLVIDRSSSMRQDDKLADAKAAATAFVDEMDTALVQVGIVAFDDEVDDVLDLSTDKNALRQAIASITLDRGTNLVDSLEAGRRMVTGPSARSDATPVIVFMTDGNHSSFSPRISALDAVIAAVRAAEIDTYAIGLGDDADDAVLRRIVSAPSNYYGDINGGQLADIYLQIAGRIEAGVLFETITIQDEVPANMRYLIGSAVPAAAWDAGRRVLTWTFDQVPEPGLSMTYRLEPLTTGTHPTNVRATADFRDGLGNDDTLRFPVPEVIVTGPIYLPVLLNERCDPKTETLDVVLLLDLSTSMDGPTRVGGLSKRAAAAQAAGAFSDQLRLTRAGERDQLAILGFQGDASVLSPLGSSRAEVRAALAALPRGAGTRIDLGLDLARDVLTGPARLPQNRPVILLLTDGRPSFDDEASTLAAAAQARSAGLELYAIGLGADVQPSLLEAVAGSPDRYFAAPEADALAALYRRLAQLIPCPGGRHDWASLWP
jgi:Mg-chelatase subunit ChlD